MSPRLLTLVLAAALSQAPPALAEPPPPSSASELLDRWRAMSIPEKRAFREKMRQDFLLMYQAAPPDEQRRILEDINRDHQERVQIKKRPGQSAH